MISFRYHLVSIVAVFAALAVGIIAGSTVVKQSLVDSTKQNLDRTERQLAEMSDAQNELTDRVDRYEEFGEAASIFLTDRLDGVPIVIVSGPEVSDAVSAGLDQAIDVAGGDVVGRLRIDGSLGDDDALSRLAGALDSPSRDAGELRAELGRRVGAGIVAVADSIASSLDRQAEAEDRPDVTTTTATTTTTLAADGGAQGETTVAEVPVAATAGVTDATIEATAGDQTSAVPEPSVGESTSTTVAATTTAPATTTTVPLEVVPSDGLRDAGLRSLDRANLVRVDDVGDTFVPSKRLVVLVITDRRNGVVVDDVVTALLASLGEGGVAAVLTEAGDLPADDDTTTASVVSEVRDDGELRDAVSTVDDAERFPGWIATVLTMQERLSGRVGHYGRHDGSRGLLPSLP